MCLCPDVYFDEKSMVEHSGARKQRHVEESLGMRSAAVASEQDLVDLVPTLIPWSRRGCCVRFLLSQPEGAQGYKALLWFYLLSGTLYNTCNLFPEALSPDPALHQTRHMACGEKTIFSL